MRTIAFAPPVTEDYSPFERSRFSAEASRFSNIEAESGAGTVAEVAALSADRILTMTRAELVEVIGSVRGGHLRPGVQERLPQLDCETLRRLVFLTRRYCRNQQQLTEGVPAGAAYCG